MLKEYTVTLASGVDVTLEVEHIAFVTIPAFMAIDIRSAWCGEYLEDGEVSNVVYGTWDVGFEMVPSLKVILTAGRDADTRMLAVIHDGHCSYVFLEA